MNLLRLQFFENQNTRIFLQNDNMPGAGFL